MQLLEYPDWSAYKVRLLCINKIYLPCPSLGLFNWQGFHSQGSILLEDYFKNYSCSSCVKHWVLVWNVWMRAHLHMVILKHLKLTTSFQHQPINAIQANVMFNSNPVTLISFPHWSWTRSILCLVSKMLVAFLKVSQRL